MQKFTYTTTIVSDSDGDGIDDVVENAGPNAGDSNIDGILDSNQSYVATFVNSVSGHCVTVEVTSDCVLDSLSVSAEHHSTPDIGYTYPEGLVNFTVTDCDTTSTTVNLYVHDVEDTDFVVRNFTPVNGSYSTIEGFSLSSVLVGSTRSVRGSYVLVDNGPIDSNPIVGTMTDPVGLGVLVVGAPRTGLGGTAG